MRSRALAHAGRTTLSERRFEAAWPLLWPVLLRLAGLLIRLRRLLVLRLSRLLSRLLVRLIGLLVLLCGVGRRRRAARAAVAERGRSLLGAVGDRDRHDRRAVRAELGPDIA